MTRVLSLPQMALLISLVFGEPVHTTLLPAMPCHTDTIPAPAFYSIPYLQEEQLVIRDPFHNGLLAPPRPDPLLVHHVCQLQAAVV